MIHCYSLTVKNKIILNTKERTHHRNEKDIENEYNLTLIDIIGLLELTDNLAD